MYSHATRRSQIRDWTIIVLSGFTIAGAGYLYFDGPNGENAVAAAPRGADRAAPAIEAASAPEPAVDATTQSPPAGR